MSFTERLALVISAKADQALREIKRVGGEAGQLGQKLAGTGSAAAGLGSTLKAGLAAGAAAGAAALAALAKQAIEAASALQEQVSATNQVFGSASQQVIDFGKKAANAFGISNRAALQAANQFGDLFINVGVSENNAAKFSTQLVRLAADLASFKDLDPGDVLQRLSSGLVGETEPLRRLGIVMNESTVQAKAMELGIAGARGEVSDGAKVQARYAIILEKTAKAQGDVARTADSLANRQRAANARLEDAKARIGEDLVPAAATATDVLSRAVDAAGKLGPVLLKGIPGAELLGGAVEFLGRRSAKTAEAYEQLTAAEAQQALVTETARIKQEQFNDALKEASEVADLYAKRVQTVRGATEDLISSQQDVSGAVGDLADAQADAAEKQKALSDAIKAHGRNSHEAQVAAREYDKAQRDEIRTVDALAKARRDFAVQQAEQAGATVSDADKYRIYRDELIKLKDAMAPGSPLRVHMEELIDQIPPPVVAFAVHADTSQAVGALLGLQKLAASIRAETMNVLGAGALEMNALADRLAAPKTGPNVLGARTAPTVTQNITINARTDAKGSEIAREVSWRGRGWGS